MTLHELVDHLNKTRNSKLEVIPFTIHASTAYNLVFLRSKEQPSIAYITVEKLHILPGNGVIQLCRSTFCFEEIAATDLLAAAVQANAAAEQHGINHLINTSCRMDVVARMAELIPFEWSNAYLDRMAILSFTNKFKDHVRGLNPKLTLTEVQK